MLYIALVSLISTVSPLFRLLVELEALRDNWSSVVSGTSSDHLQRGIELRFLFIDPFDIGFNLILEVLYLAPSFLCNGGHGRLFLISDSVQS